MPNKIPDHQWQVISIDLITELPLSQGFDAILVIIDCLSKRIHTIPMTTKVNSSGIARLFLHHVWHHHSLPEEVISDQGSTFISKFSKELSTLLGIKTTPSTAHHPQTDGQTECINQEIETFLQIFINHCQDDWAEWIPIAEFAYNNHVHSSTLHTPFQLNSGQHPCMGTKPLCSSMVEAADEFAKCMTAMQTEVKAALHHAVDEMSKYHNQHCQHAPTYNEGNRVWLNAANYSTNRPTKKLDHKWLGPFTIVKVISCATIKLKLSLKERGIHPVISISDVCPYLPDHITTCPADTLPGPTLVHGHKEYKVKTILNSKHICRKLHYYVKWKGYPNSENSWLLVENLHSPELLADFHDCHPLATLLNDCPFPGLARSLRGR